MYYQYILQYYNYLFHKHTCCRERVATPSRVECLEDAPHKALPAKNTCSSKKGKSILTLA